jgi:hypothetical protein
MDDLEIYRNYASSQFPQSNLLSNDKFLKYIEALNFKIKKEDLEY